MPYVLGIDVGTDHTAAALCRRRGSGWGEVDIVRLGARSSTVASVLYLSEQGSLLVGDAAVRRAPADPSRVARGFGPRVGDDVPLMLGGTPQPAQALTASLIGWVVGRAAAAEGAPPEHLVVTHPASWGHYRKGLLHGELRRLGLRGVTLLPEPIAAAESHASREGVEAGSALAVYGLGSGTFEAAVVRRAPTGAFELLSSAESAEPLGGVHFEDLLIDHVRAKLGPALDELDPAHPQARVAMSMLRQLCVEAKERLSVTAEVTIPVQLPNVRTQVHLTRAEFEEMIRPALAATVEELLRAVRLSAVPATELGGVLLVGGSSRIPLVVELVSAGLPGPVAVAVDSQVAITKGAALAARRMVTGALADSPSGEPTSIFARPVEDAAPRRPGTELELAHVHHDRGHLDRGDVGLAEPPARPAVAIVPLELPEKRSVMRFARGNARTLGAAALMVIVIGATLAFVLYPKSSAHPTPVAPAVSRGSQSAATVSNSASESAHSSTRQPTSVAPSTEPSTRGRH